MSESHPSYTSTAPIGEIKQAQLDLSEWERNVILRMRQLAATGRMILIDGDARCWYEVGKLECHKDDRELPFRM